MLRANIKQDDNYMAFIKDDYLWNKFEYAQYHAGLCDEVFQYAMGIDGVDINTWLAILNYQPEVAYYSNMLSNIVDAMIDNWSNPNWLREEMDAKGFNIDHIQKIDEKK